MFYYTEAFQKIKHQPSTLRIFWRERVMDMDEKLIYTAGSTAGCQSAASYLKDLGLPVITSPCDAVRYLLLDVPAFGPNGQLRGGGDIRRMLGKLPGDILVCGGNLSHPALDGYEKVDFLMDESYLSENAYITAECALDVALPYLNQTIRHMPILIIGWGRIGKCLADILKKLDAEVTVAARGQKDRAMIHAFGYSAVDMDTLPLCLSHFHLLYNTVPQPVLNQEQMSECREDCVKIELASKPGMEGDDIIIARGLPGLHMPESSGKLIAETFIRLCYGR